MDDPSPTGVFPNYGQPLTAFRREFLVFPVPFDLARTPIFPPPSPPVDQAHNVPQTTPAPPRLPLYKPSAFSTYRGVLGAIRGCPSPAQPLRCGFSSSSYQQRSLGFSPSNAQGGNRALSSDPGKTRKYSSGLALYESLLD